MSSDSPQLESLVVRAGAGAGKTSRLVKTVLDLANDFIEKTGKPPRLVVTTFTRKATQELKERLVIDAFDRKQEALLDFVSSRSQLHISTIHGVLSLFLRRYGHLANLDNNFGVLSESEALRQAKSIFRDIFLEDPSRDDLIETFDLSQWVQFGRWYEALLCERPDLKSHDKGIFSKVFETKKLDWVSRFKAISKRILSETDDEDFGDYAGVLAQVADYLIEAGPEDFQKKAQSSIEAMPSKPRMIAKNPKISEELNQDLMKLLKDFKAELESETLNSEKWIEWIQQNQEIEPVLKKFVKLFSQYKKTTGQFEIRDLELFTLEIVQSSPELAEAFSADWDYWMIDEYQDTSPLQVQILKSLVGKRESFVVGDPQQSIYLFRGARSEVFTEREESLKRSGGRTETQLVNFRSNPPLLKFFNDFFLKLSPDHFVSMSPGKKDTDFSGPAVSLYKAPLLEKEADPRANENLSIVHHVLKLVREQGAKFDEICILSRKNSILMELAQSLQSFGLPTHVHAASGFYERREIQDALAILKFLLNPHDDLNLLSVMRSPWFRVPDQTLRDWAKLRGLKSYWSFVESLDSKPEAATKLTQILHDRDRIGVAASFEKTVLECGLIDFARFHDPTGRRESNLWKLLVQVSKEEKMPGLSWLSLLDPNLKKSRDLDQSDESDAVASMEPNCINLMTVHASKGLQFKHVIIPRCDQGPKHNNWQPQVYCEETGSWGLAFKSEEEGKLKLSLVDRFALQSFKTRELEEYDRLLYVAMTRAKESLCLTWAGEPDSQSWMGRSQWLLNIEGEKDFKDYKVFSDSGPWNPEKWLSLDGKSDVPLLPFPKSEVEAPEILSRISVSQLLEEEMDSALGSGRTNEVRAEDLRRAAEGVLFHRLMESMHYQSELAFVDLAKSWLDLPEVKILELKEFLENLKSPPLKRLLETGHVEWGFQLLEGSRIIEGQIDLWGEDQETVWLVDYKTGSDRYLEKAMKQLDIYARALRKSGIKKPIQRAVIFPMLKKVFTEPSTTN